MTDLKEVFKQAVELAQLVPENMQEAAFNRALDFLTPDAGLGATGSASRRQSQKRQGLSQAKKSSAVLQSRDRTSKSPQKTGSGLAPKSAISSLIESGFFTSGKTRAEVQTHLRTTRGYTIGTDQLGVAMLRLVRERVLERAENEQGQYEFKLRNT